MPMQESSLLLALPEPCLLAVLQYCAADDQPSLFSAARAHSRLRQAAAAALPGIAADLPQKAESVKLYLKNHGQHVSSVNLKGAESLPVSLRQLPPELQLKSLQLEWFDLQLYPGSGSKWASSPDWPIASFQGVLGDAARVAALTQLRLTDCDLLDGPSSGGLAALSLLPTGLQHLSISRIFYRGGYRAQFSAGALPRLQQLTYLELDGMYLVAPAKAEALDFPPVFFLGRDDEGQGEEGEEEGEAAALQPLQALARLAELRLHNLQLDTMVPAGDDSTLAIPCRITAGLLPSTHLTCLVLSGGVGLEPDALAGKNQLQHLDLDLADTIPGAAAEVGELLSCIQPLQELTHLHLGHLCAGVVGGPPPAAYSALTASSKLQHLDISGCRLPIDGLVHLFPTGRQLPQLQSLNIANVLEPGSGYITVPEGSRLVSCCPSLQCLDVRGLQGLNGERLAPLQGLSGLHTLRVAGDGLSVMGWEAVCQLKGLRELDLHYPRATVQQMLQSTQLGNLTRFVYQGFGEDFVLTAQAPEDEPVWHQVPGAVLQLQNLPWDPPAPLPAPLEW